AGGPVFALAARRGTRTIPIVFTTIADPGRRGLVDGLSHPGGNATGTGGVASGLDEKRAAVLHPIKPAAPRLRGVGDTQLPRRTCKAQPRSLVSNSPLKTPGPNTRSIPRSRGLPNDVSKPWS